MTDKQKKKCNLGFKIVGKIASAIMNITSFILAIVTARNGNVELSWKIVVSIIILNTILIAVFAAYAAILWFVNNKIRKENTQKLNKELEKFNDAQNEMIEFKCSTQKNISFLETSIEFSQSLNGLCIIQINKSLSDMSQCIEKITSVVKSREGFARKNDRIIEYLEELKTNIKKRYNDFFTDCTEKLKTILDLNFENRNLNIKNSITIKQLKTALFWKDKNTKAKAISNAQIITTFRDLHTYTHFNREVGRRIYTISGNTDFNHCLNNPHFFLNDLNSSDIDNYQNENAEFKSFYNCTVVVPIFVPEAFGKKYYGYLTTDTLNSDSSLKEVYNKQMIKIMKNTASVIAMYFNIMEQHWGDALNTIKDIIIKMPKPKNVPLGSSKSVDFEIEFLNMVFNLKYKSYNSNDDEVRYEQ